MSWLRRSRNVTGFTVKTVEVPTTFYNDFSSCLRSVTVPLHLLYNVINSHKKI